MSFPIIESGYNAYRNNVQGKANEPVCVAGVLDRARRLHGVEVKADLGEIWERLDRNAPRIAIIGGSPDHPAHIMDLDTTLRAAVRIWENGGVPFAFGVPVVCDGTAQNTPGMCYSLQSRNAVTSMVINQMEGQGYHGAFVIQGCDKTPMAIVSALASLDITRQARGEASVFATFAPSHVLKGGTIPADLHDEIEDLAQQAERAGHADIGDDLRDALAYILQCSSNTAFQGVFMRAMDAGLLNPTRHRDFEKRLAVNTCDSKGGICAFHGTGNSSRDIVSAFGLVHPALELLIEPPTQPQINEAVDALFGYADNPAYSVATMVRANIENTVRVHSALGGSTNLTMHIVAAMLHAGVDFSLDSYDAIRRATPIPDIFNYSLTEGRDVYALAQQCCNGEIRGMETVFYELSRHNVPLNIDAPTATGTTWRQRLSNTDHLSADGVKVNPIIVSKPVRQISGIDILRSNWFENAVVKISGMPERQLNAFDSQVAVVVYFENEDAANHFLLQADVVPNLRQRLNLSDALLTAIRKHNAPPNVTLDYHSDLFARMMDEGTLKLAVVISGQGPEAYGMPEMFTPMQHVNASQTLKKVASILSDGRYSGVSYGAAIGHITPEAARGGGILYLQDGDLIHMRLLTRQLTLLDSSAVLEGHIEPSASDLAQDRAELGRERLERIRRRQRVIAPPNRMDGFTDASRGVVPPAVAASATDPWQPIVPTAPPPAIRAPITA